MGSEARLVGHRRQKGAEGPPGIEVSIGCSNATRLPPAAGIPADHSQA
jgi:hypothetical protein